MRSDLLVLAADLVAREEPFALATVVRREPPSSAQPGDMALITREGAFHGWLGGSCTKPTVLREALRALADGMPRLIALSPDPASDRRPGVAVFPMNCHSGGSVEIYVEPVLPPVRLVIFGLSPLAQALSRLAKAMGYAVDAVNPASDRSSFPEADRVLTDLEAPERLRQRHARSARLFAVVATMGERDEEATLCALAVEPAYLAVVASPRRFAQIRETLIARGAPAESLERIKNPAGLDIGARSPEEIAVSILAEIVQVRNAKAGQLSLPPEAGRFSGQERDPICGMVVEVSTAIEHAEFRGHSYYFCCAGCRERFLATPERYAAFAETGGAG